MNIVKSIKQFSLPFWFVIVLLFTIAISIFTRAQGLGYSGFQGDEVNTVDFIYEMHDGNVINYLFSQKRGPTQYVINLLNYFAFGYHDELWIRLPYLIFGVIALYSIFILSKKIFGRNVAIIVSTLMAINGLFIAFARITQYQSVMYCIIPIAVFLFIKALTKMSYKWMLVTGLLMSITLLTHYDTLSVTPFFIVMILGKFFREGDYTKSAILKYLKLTLVFGLAFILPALAFYIPFTLSHEFERRTSGYLEDRLLGGGLMPRTKLTMYLLSMYEPIFVMASIYLFAVASGLFYSNLVSFEILKLKIKPQLVKIGFILLILVNAGASYMSLFYFKPRASTVLVVLSSIAIAGILLISKRISVKYAALMTWFLGAYSMYFYLVKDPRTHVYVVFIPAFILAGYTIYKIYKSFSFSHLVQTVYLGVISMAFVYVIGFNWMVFVDRAPEYPWFDKEYFGSPIFEIPKVRHKKIDGVFGFNQWRGWEVTADYFQKGCLKGTYDSNEKNSVTYFYMRQNQVRGEEGFLPGRADNLIVVEGPHSWEYENQRIYLGYDLVKIIKSNDIPVTFIYSRNYDPTCFSDTDIN